MRPPLRPLLPLLVASLLLVPAPAMASSAWAIEVVPLHTLSGEYVNVTVTGPADSYHLLRLQAPNGTYVEDLSGWTDANGSVRYAVSLADGLPSGRYLFIVVHKGDQVANGSFSVTLDDFAYALKKINLLDDRLARAERRIIVQDREIGRLEDKVAQQDGVIWAVTGLCIFLAFTTLLLLRPYLRYASTRIRGRSHLLGPVKRALNPDPECDLAQFHPGLEEERKRLVREQEPEADGKSYLVKVTSKMNPREVYEVEELAVETPKLIIPVANGADIKDVQVKKKGRLLHRFRVRILGDPEGLTPFQAHKAKKRGSEGPRLEGMPEAPASPEPEPEPEPMPEREEIAAPPPPPSPLLPEPRPIAKPPAPSQIAQAQQLAKVAAKPPVMSAEHAKQVDNIDTLLKAARLLLEMDGGPAPQERPRERTPWEEPDVVERAEISERQRVADLRAKGEYSPGNKPEPVSEPAIRSSLEDPSNLSEEDSRPKGRPRVRPKPKPKAKPRGSKA